MTNDLAVTATGLVKTFGKTKALRGIDLSVPRGSVLSVLGPNGAGKTTAVRILTTLLKADAGQASVLGFDVATQADAVRRRIGLAGQAATVDEILTGRQNLELVGRLYQLDKPTQKRRANELLEQFSLADAGDRQAKEYSGGMRRRLDLAAALVAQPELLILDEPTTGLDPRSRNELWEVLKQLVADGATLLLTTQYLEEADQLSDQIAVIDHGQVIARGTASELKREVGGERLAVTTENAADLAAVAEILRQITGDEPVIEANSRRVTVNAPDLTVLAKAAEAISQAQVAIDDIGLHRPTLDDVFLTLTGRPAEETEETA